MTGVFDRIEPPLVSKKTGNSGTVEAVERLEGVSRTGDGVDMLLV